MLVVPCRDLRPGAGLAAVGVLAMWRGHRTPAAMSRLPRQRTEIPPKILSSAVVKSVNAKTTFLRKCPVSLGNKRASFLFKGSC